MQPLVIVIEGPDGAGKTTYADLLIAKAYAAGVEHVYIHNGSEDAKLPGKLWRHYRAQMLDGLDRDNTLTIIDRSFLSEMVYGPVYRGKSRVTQRQARKLQRWAAHHNVALVGIEADFYLRRTRVRNRGEEWVAADQWAITTGYEEYFHENDYAWTTVEATSANTSEGNE